MQYVCAVILVFESARYVGFRALLMELFRAQPVKTSRLQNKLLRFFLYERELYSLNNKITSPTYFEIKKLCAAWKL